MLPIRPGAVASAGTPGLRRLDLSTLEVCYRYRQTYDDHLAGCVQDWEFDARAYLDDGDGSLAERDDDETVFVGRGEALLVDLHAHRSPFDALDEHSEAAKEIAEVVLDPATGELRRDFLDGLEGIGGHLLVLLDIHVEPAWRGHQTLGAIIGGFAVEALSPSAQAVVCRPESHELTDADEAGAADPTRHRSATSELHSMTGTLGFVSYRSGVFYLDTALVTFPEAFAALLLDSTATPPA